MSDSSSKVPNRSSSTSPPEFKEIRMATAPFDDPEADVVLRSSDGVDFHVFKPFLSWASPTFRTMFALPQLDEPDPTITTKREDGTSLPVIIVTGDEETLQIVLRLSYPNTGQTLPVRDELESIVRILEAGRKYCMSSVTAYAKVKLVGYAKGEPVRVYAVACCYGFRDVAKNAAQLFLRIPYESFRKSRPVELKQITGEALQCLFQYRLDCQEAAVSCTRSWGSWKTQQTKRVKEDWVTGWSYFFTVCHQRHDTCNLDTPLVPEQSDSGKRFHAWWIQYMRKMSGTLQERPWEELVTSDEVLAAFVNSSPRCQQCHSSAISDTAKFAAAFREEIQWSPLKVILNLDHIRESV